MFFLFLLSFLSLSYAAVDYLVLTRSVKGKTWLLLEGHLNGLQLPLNETYKNFKFTERGIIKTSGYLSGTLNFATCDVDASSLEGGASRPEKALFRRWFLLPLPTNEPVNNLSFLSIKDEAALERTFLYSQSLFALIQYSRFSAALGTENFKAEEGLEVRVLPHSPTQQFMTFAGMLPVRIFQNDTFVLLESQKPSILTVFTKNAPVDRFDSIVQYLKAATDSVHPFKFPFVGDEPYFMNRKNRLAILSSESQQQQEEVNTNQWTGQFVLVERIDLGHHTLAQREHRWVHFKDLLQKATKATHPVRMIETKRVKDDVYGERVVKQVDGQVDPALLMLLTSPLNQEIIAHRYFSVKDEPSSNPQTTMEPWQVLVLAILSLAMGILIPFILLYKKKQ